MTPPRRPSRFPRPWAAATIVLLSLGAVSAWTPRRALAQACCVGTGLVTPARLRVFEDYAAGVQTRARSVMGSFDAGGDYVRSPPGDDELDLEQDFFAAARAGEHLQASLKIPFVETGRRSTGASAWGGGLGDVSANLRYDLTFAGDRPWWPGIALLAGLSVPTGRTVEQSSDPSGATGLGSYEGNVGVAVEQVMGRAFLSATGFVAQQTTRTVATVTQSFGPRLTALLAGGYAFPHEITVGAFVLASRRSDQALVTAGGAVAVPLGSAWRAQGTLSAELPFAGWGRQEPTGAALSLSLLRVWL
jgi:hypothetical protein